jgi:hypothetical protein
MMTLTPQEVQSDMAQHREGLCSLIFSNPARIFVKGDIENPMQGILYSPVLPHRLGEPHGINGKRG